MKTLIAYICGILPRFYSSERKKFETGEGMRSLQGREKAYKNTVKKHEIHRPRVGLGMDGG
jgi:hypothetical protein